MARGIDLVSHANLPNDVGTIKGSYVICFFTGILKGELVQTFTVVVLKSQVVKQGRGFATNFCQSFLKFQLRPSNIA